jgi:hopanoid biosynthesis associated protein HpnK
MPYCATEGRAKQTPMLGSDRPTYEEAPGVRFIVNADDFGRTEAINAAVAQAHSEGILTSASLMVGGSAASDAVRLARDNPHLAVGLHLVLLGGRATLTSADIPHLVDGEGLFPRRPVRTGLRYFFSRKAHVELAKEIRAQFEAFQATGLPLSHVDGHHHMHLHPTVFRLLLPPAHEYGAEAIRVSVSDDLLFSLRQDHRHLLLKLGWKIAFSLLGRRARRSLRRQPVPAADRVYGLMQSGCVTESYLIRLLDRLAGRAATESTAAPSGRAPVFEVFCHPSLNRESRRLGPNPGDLEALLSPAVRAAVDANSVLLTTYPEAWGPSLERPSAIVTPQADRQPTGDPTE